MRGRRGDSAAFFFPKRGVRRRFPERRRRTMAVKFLESHTVGALYNEGEIAGFDKKTEEDLIERKIAKPYKAEAEPVPKA
jgi:hypothetical protein